MFEADLKLKSLQFEENLLSPLFKIGGALRNLVIKKLFSVADQLKMLVRGPSICYWGFFGGIGHMKKEEEEKK